MAISISVDISAISDGTQIDAADVTVALNNLKTALENVLNGIQEAESIRFTEIATPSNPAAAMHKMYFKADGNLYSLDNSGTERSVYSIDIVQYQCFT